jgi:hyperosmotically inducible protein
MNRSLLVAVIGVLSLTMAPLASAQRSAGESVDDSTIAVSVKTALIDSRSVDAGKINVEAYKRAVQLSGYVPDKDQKSAALAIAKGADGVTSVRDGLIVMGGKRSFGRTIDDQTIHAQVTLKIAGVAGMDDAIDVVAHVRNGEVLLGGFVDNDDVRKGIEAAARSVSGVEKVHNRMETKS